MTIQDTTQHGEPTDADARPPVDRALSRWAYRNLLLSVLVIAILAFLRSRLGPRIEAVYGMEAERAARRVISLLIVTTAILPMQLVAWRANPAKPRPRTGRRPLTVGSTHRPLERLLHRGPDLLTPRRVVVAVLSFAAVMVLVNAVDLLLLIT